MRTPFELNDRDFSRYVHKTGIEADFVPVYASKVTTLDGVDHNVIARWKSRIRVLFNPTDRDGCRILCEQLKAASVKVHYYNPHLGEVTQFMRVENIPYVLALIDQGKERYDSFALTFTEN